MISTAMTQNRRFFAQQGQAKPDIDQVMKKQQHYLVDCYP
jgi:hypothetical protein